MADKAALTENGNGRMLLHSWCGDNKKVHSWCGGSRQMGTAEMQGAYDIAQWPVSRAQTRCGDENDDAAMNGCMNR